MRVGFYIVATMLALSGGLIAQTTSPIVGVSEITCPGGSDTWVGIPYHNNADYVGSAHRSVRNKETNQSTITVRGTSTMVADAYANTHYLIVKTGRQAGRVVSIVSNTENDITLSGPLTLARNDRFEIIRGLTIESLFPHATQTTFHQSSGNLPSEIGSELMIMPASSAGANTSPTEVYFVKSDGWVSTDGFTTAGDVMIPPGTVFVVRHPATAADTVLNIHGDVASDPLRVALHLYKGITGETIVSPIYAEDRKLSELGLTTSLVRARDTVSLFDNTASAVNKDPAVEYSLVGRKWKVAETGEDANDVIVPAGSALVIKKAAATKDSVVIWKQRP